MSNTSESITRAPGGTVNAAPGRCFHPTGGEADCQRPATALVVLLLTLR